VSCSPTWGCPHSITAPGYGLYYVISSFILAVFLGLNLYLAQRDASLNREQDAKFQKKKKRFSSEMDDFMSFFLFANLIFLN
jgi:hypothetical protein